jgi:hypothetical protein
VKDITLLTPGSVEQISACLGRIQAPALHNRADRNLDQDGSRKLPGFIRFRSIAHGSASMCPSDVFMPALEEGSHQPGSAAQPKLPLPARGLTRWIRGDGGEWLEVVLYAAKRADGSSFSDQLVPAWALKQR